MTTAQPGGGDGVRAMELSGELGTCLRSSESSIDGGGLDNGDDDRDMLNDFAGGCDKKERLTTSSCGLRKERATKRKVEMVGAGRGKQPEAKSKSSD